MKESSGRLDGKVAVIVGGGRGIGRATALQLARAGATVVVAARGISECQAGADSIREEGGCAFAVAVDVADWASVQRLVAETGRLAGCPDFVVVSAGVVEPAGRVWEVSPHEWAGSVQINLVGAFNAVRTFLPGMIARGDGTVVLVSSGATKHATPGWSAYGAAKSGLDYLGRNLQAELDLAGLPISVYVVYPGIVDTPMQEIIRGMSEADFPDVSRFRLLHEQGRLRPPEEPAALIWWLAASAPPDLCGQVADIGDPAIRGRMATDLGLPQF